MFSESYLFMVFGNELPPGVVVQADWVACRADNKGKKGRFFATKLPWHGTMILCYDSHVDVEDHDVTPFEFQEKWLLNVPLKCQSL